MTPIDIIVPQLSDVGTEMVVLEWLVEEDEQIEKGLTIMEVESEKATFNIEAPLSGTIEKLMVQKGDIIKVGQVIGTMLPDGAMNQPGAEKLYGVMLRLSVICDHCNNAMPVNGFMEKVKCGKCQEITELKGRLRWAEILNYQNPSIDIFKATQKHHPGKGDHGAWAPVKLKTWRNWPTCSACKHSFDHNNIKLAIERNGLLNCPKCGATQHMKPPPEFILKIFPQILYSVDKVVDGGTSKITSSKPIVMACMSCGGSLRVDGKGRMVDCEFCNSSNYLPDDLWLAMHPQEKMEDWFIIFGPG